MTAEPFDLICVGSGFASLIFLHETLQHAPPTFRALVIERGSARDHAWQLDHPDQLAQEARSTFHNPNPSKAWRFTTAVGGGSNCWIGCTPRMLPEDFRLATTHGVGADWPLTYDELEPYYCDAEDLMAIAGPSDDSPFPRSRAYPQPPHTYSTVDVAMKNAWPDAWYHQPCARPTQALATGRPACCGSAACTLCPVDSKFTLVNGLPAVLSDPRVTLRPDSQVGAIHAEGNTVRGVTVRNSAGDESRVEADVVHLGANAMFNAALLLASGLDHGPVGRGLVEQVSTNVTVDLADIDNHLGSTLIVGHGYMGYAGPHRAERAAVLIESFSRPIVRAETGRWLRRARFKWIVEDLRQDQNRVEVSPEDGRPVAHFEGVSGYAQATLDRVADDAAVWLAPLDPESIEVESNPNPTESHIMGTHVMGSDPATSVVDAGLVHHRYRNLIIGGSGVFPTAAPANPTLTISALALRSARRLYAKDASA